MVWVKKGVKKHSDNTFTGTVSPPATSADTLPSPVSTTDLLVVQIDNMDFSAANFYELIQFLGAALYSSQLCLPASVPREIVSAVSCVFVLNDDVLIQKGLIEQARKCCKVFFAEVLRRLYWSTSLLDAAVRITLQNAVFPPSGNRIGGGGWFELTFDGNLVWIEEYSNSSSTSVGSGLFSDMGFNLSGSSFAIDGVTDDASSMNLVPVSRPRGRPPKADTPRVQNQVKRCTRLNKEGYIHAELPNGPSQRKKSKVKKADAPAVLQITEMQRIGMEHCQIAPEELTEERLLQSRDK
jgi:hypothetical protein